MTLQPPAPAPRHAATLVLLRDGIDGLEVLLTVRPRHFRFMGGAVVFPGGAVAPSDLDGRWARASARSPVAAPAELHEAGGAAALGSFVCALREAFEEVGLLLGEGPTHEFARADAAQPERFLERCLDLGVVLSTDQLVPAGRWVTPVGSPVRFDTRFFLARAPAQWQPVPNPEEVAGCRWSTPADALGELAAGRAIMAPPTIDVLQRLRSWATVDAALTSVVAGSLEGSSALLAARLSPLVQVVVAPNPGQMTGPGTNTYVVGTGPTWVIDPAVQDPAYIDRLAEVAGDVAAIIVTHRHPDHVGGVAAFLERTEAPVAAFGPQRAGGADVVPLADGDILRISGATLRVLHAPGHARDQLALLLEEEKALFAGDTVLGEGTPVISPPEGDMRTYLATLRRLATFGADRIYPGHFRALDGGEDVWRRLLEHRAEREAGIIAALHPSGSSIEDIVRLAYEGTPLELHPVAERSALAHLEMLAQDGKVLRTGRLWRAQTG
ncbi:MAG: MBL fold metallo-hydrolase [Actinomycetota bacterium]